MSENGRGTAVSPYGPPRHGCRAMPELATKGGRVAKTGRQPPATPNGAGFQCRHWRGHQFQLSKGSKSAILHRERTQGIAADDTGSVTGAVPSEPPGNKETSDSQRQPCGTRWAAIDLPHLGCRRTRPLETKNPPREYRSHRVFHHYTWAGFLPPTRRGPIRRRHEARQTAEAACKDRQQNPIPPPKNVALVGRRGRHAARVPHGTTALKTPLRLKLLPAPPARARMGQRKARRKDYS